MKIAITIGCFKLVDFVELNIARCKTIFPDSPILICDDKSDKSDEIRDLAAREQCYYTVSNAPRGHFGGDVQVIISSISFCEVQQCDISLKLSMRLVPVLPRFRELVEQPFNDPKINIVVPGRISPHQFADSTKRFYGAFGILTDVIAIRRGAITAQEFKAGYEKHFAKGRMHPSLLVECYLGELLSVKFPGASVVSDELANHRPGTAAVFLRKSQCTSLSYAQVAKFHGLSGVYDTREHSQLWTKDYLCRPWVQGS